VKNENELERIREEVVVKLFKVLSRHSSGGTEENHDSSQDFLSPDRDLNPGLIIAATF
jgi:hypothetical protein